MTADGQAVQNKMLQSECHEFDPPPGRPVNSSVCQGLLSETGAHLRENRTTLVHIQADLAVFTSPLAIFRS